MVQDVNTTASRTALWADKGSSLVSLLTPSSEPCQLPASPYSWNIALDGDARRPLVYGHSQIPSKHGVDRDTMRISPSEAVKADTKRSGERLVSFGVQASCRPSWRRKSGSPGQARGVRTEVPGDSWRNKNAHLTGGQASDSSWRNKNVTLCTPDVRSCYVWTSIAEPYHQRCLADPDRRRFAPGSPLGLSASAILGPPTITSGAGSNNNYLGGYGTPASTSLAPWNTNNYLVGSVEHQQLPL